MKKLMKRTIACLIAILMAISTMPFTALADSETLVANWDFSSSLSASSFQSTVNSSDHLYATHWISGSGTVYGDPSSNSSLLSSLSYSSTGCKGAANTDGFYYLSNFSDFYSGGSGFKVTWQETTVSKTSDSYTGFFALGSAFGSTSDSASYGNTWQDGLALNYSGTVYQNGSTSGTSSQFASNSFGTTYTFTLDYDCSTKSISVTRVNETSSTTETKSYTLNSDPVSFIVCNSSKGTFPSTILNNLKIYKKYSGPTASLNVSGYGCECKTNNNRCTETKLNIVNDSEDGNFSIGYIDFDISGIDTDKYMAKSGEYTFTYSIDSGREAVGLSIYYPTIWATNFTNSALNNISLPDAITGSDGGHLDRTISNYDLQLIKSVDTTAGTSGSVTVDITDAVNQAIKNDMSYASIVILCSKAGQTGVTNDYTDTYVTVNTNAVTVSLTDTTIKSDTSTISKHTSSIRPADGTTSAQPFIQNTTGNCPYFRIPGIVTMNDGTVVASADARWGKNSNGNVADGGGIDTVVTRSTDNGATWNYTFANYLDDNGSNQFNTDYSAFCDTEIATDGTKLYMMTTVLPAGTGLNSNLTMPITGSLFTSDGYLYLGASTNGKISSYSYCLGDFDENGFAHVYSVSSDKIGSIATGTYSWSSTTYNNKDLLVDENFNIYNKPAAGGDYVYQSNLFYKTTPFGVRKTCQLAIRKSTDGGATWSSPTMLDVKADDEYFYGVGPGRGVTSSNGQYIFFSAYKYAGASAQRSSLVYSTDGGATWKRSANAHESQCSESQVVILGENEDGSIDLRLFFRSGSETSIEYQDATMSSSGTITWESSTHTISGTTKTADCQISAFMYSKTIGGQKVIFVSTPTKSGSRANGYIYALFLNDDYTVASTKSYAVNSGTYAYSCMTELSDGRIALVYESADGAITYKVLSLKELTGTSSGDLTGDQVSVEQDSSTVKDDTSHNYGTAQSLANALYRYKASTSSDSSAISGTFSHNGIYLSTATPGVLGVNSSTTMNIRATGGGSGYENTFYIYNSSGCTPHFYYDNYYKFDGCSSYSGDIEHHAMYIYKPADDDSYSADGIVGFKKVTSLSEIKDGDQLLFVHPDCAFGSVSSSTTYYCIFPSTSTSNYGNHVGKIGNFSSDIFVNTDYTSSGSSDSEIKTEVESDIEHGAYKGSATRAADGSYTSSTLTGGDTLSGCLWTYGVGSNSSYYTSDDNNYCQFGIQFGSMTFLYDGSTTMSAPIDMYYINNSNKATSTIYSTALTTTGFTLNHPWHGCSGDAGYQTATDYYNNIVGSKTAYDSSKLRTNNNSKYYFSNSIYVDVANISFTNNLYTNTSVSFTTYFNGKYYIFLQGYDHDIDTTFTKATDNNVTINVLNYKPIADAIPTIKSYYENNVKGKENLYTASSLSEYYNAIKAVYFDPNSYFDTSSTSGNNYSACQEAINNAITNISLAEGSGLVKRQITLHFTTSQGTVTRMYLAGEVVPATDIPSLKEGFVYTFSSNYQHKKSYYAWDSAVPSGIVILNNGTYTEVETSEIVDCENVYDSISGDTLSYHCDLCNNAYTVDKSGYDSAVEEATPCISQLKYTSATRTALSNVLTSNAVDFTKKPILTQESLNVKTTEILSTLEALKGVNYAVTAYTITNGGTKVAVGSAVNIDCGVSQEFDIGSISGNVYKWGIEEKGATSVDSSLKSNSTSFNYVASPTIEDKDGTVNVSLYCYVTDDSTLASNTYSLSLLNSQGKISDNMYISCGDNTSKDVNISLTVDENNKATVTVDGTDMVVEKPSFYQITAINVNGTKITNGKSTNVTISDDTTISLSLTPCTKISIKPADGSDIYINGKNEECTAYWNKTIKLEGTKTSDSTAWLVDDVIVGYGKTYTFYATKGCEVSYVNNSSVTTPTPSISYFEYDSYKTKTVAAVSSFSLPSGMTANLGTESESANNNVYEAGIILKTDRTTTLDKSYSGQESYTGTTTLTQSNWWETATVGNYSASSITSDSHQYVISISRSATTSFIMGAVAYVKYKDASGTSHTVYSDQKLIAYKQ